MEWKVKPLCELFPRSSGNIALPDNILVWARAVWTLSGTRLPASCLVTTYVPCIFLAVVMALPPWEVWLCEDLSGRCQRGRVQGSPGPGASLQGLVGLNMSGSLSTWRKEATRGLVPSLSRGFGLGVRNGFLCSESVLAVTEEASPDDQDEYLLCLVQEIRTLGWAGTEGPTGTQSPESWRE